MRTFLETFNLLVGEGGAIALELPLETQPHLRVLVARRIVQVRVAVGDVAIVAICWRKTIEDSIQFQIDLLLHRRYNSIAKGIITKD